VTDAKHLPPEAVEALSGVDVLVLNALWFGRTHGSHFNIEEAIEASRDVGARRTFLTHLTHRVTHRELLDRLPAGVLPAYDGLTVEIG
jgi:phosphoribosyl 1,2-cyclic phosphate phosphodiesterase